VFEDHFGHRTVTLQGKAFDAIASRTKTYASTE
jgi:hypothetical protein